MAKQLMLIKARREAAGLTQFGLGEKLGVSQGVVSQWETEVTLPRVRQLPDLARVLRCSIGDLFVDVDIDFPAQ